MVALLLYLVLGTQVLGTAPATPGLFDDFDDAACTHRAATLTNREP